MPSPSRQTVFTLGALSLVAAGVAVISVSLASSPGPSPSPSEAAWVPPMVTVTGPNVDEQHLPALQGAYVNCNSILLRHEWILFADMTVGVGWETLTIDQRSQEWIEDYYGGPIDTGVRTSLYDLSWIDDYLGHPPPDGYFVWTAQVCVMSQLAAPVEIFDRMMATRAADGTQEATWGVFRATWTNDGESGPDVTFSYVRP